MFILLNPFALLTLLGLSVPVAIHLWNRRPGREVAVGSLRWLAAGANRRLRNLKPEQLWLLLLRAALLAVLAGAVAEPVWRQRRPAGRGVVLLSPAVPGTPALATLRPTIDSLRRRGYVVRWLAAGFAPAPRAAWRADSVGRPNALAGDDGLAGEFAWARVRQAARVFPGQPLFVITPAAVRHFQGPHGRLPPAVTWQLLPTAVATTWLQATTMGPDSLHLLLGQSNETQTTFRRVPVARPRPGAVLRVPGLGPLRLERGPGGDQLRSLRAAAASGAAPAPPVPVQSRALRVIIYSTAAYAADARYLQAGLRAAAVGVPVPVVLTTTAQPPPATTRPDWLFWLSDAPLPAAWRGAADQGTHIWQEAPGPGVADTATLATDEAGAAAVAIVRRGAAPASALALPLWTDGRGRAVLTRQARGRGAHYQLHTRLSPAWSALGDDPDLPARLLALLQPAPPDGLLAAPTALDQTLATHDQRALDPTQLIGGDPATSLQSRAAPRPTPAYRFVDLRPWLVLLAGLLLLLERLLAARRPETISPASV